MNNALQRQAGGAAIAGCLEGHGGDAYEMKQSAGSSPPPRVDGRARIQWAGLLAGPLAALLVYSLMPDQYHAVDGKLATLGHAGRATAGIAVWMAIWWLTEAVEVPVTALLPLVAFPLAGVATIRATAAPYGHDMIFLFLGGFVLALSMQRWGLDRRIALLALRLVGSRPRNIVGGMMLATAAMSMWVSNTATTAVMLPIALSLIGRVCKARHGRRPAPGALPEDGTAAFAVALLLGIAYAASIGGMGTIVGSPPNVFAVAFLRDNLGREIGFLQWMSVGVPLVVVFLPLTWLLLVRVLHPVPREPLLGGGFSRAAWEALGPVKAGERWTFVVFVLTATAWVARPWLQQLQLAGGAPLAGLSDAGIAMTAALLLFVLPVDRRRRIFAMDWPTATQLPWGVLLLFGGGLSLAAAVEGNGVGAYLGASVQGLAGMPPWVVVLAVTTLIIFLTELTSNTATAVTFIPVLSGIAAGLGFAPAQLVIPAALAASSAFMLPAATPPNAIVFGSGYLTIPQMARAGLWLNGVGIVLVTLLGCWLVPWLLGR